MCEDLNSVIEKDHPTIEMAKLCMLIIKKYLNDLRDHIIEHRFESPDAEIYFFKWSKPRFYSRMIYYSQLYKIELNKPPGNEDVSKKYLQGEMKKIIRFFNNNREFYHYWRSGANHLDHIYFLRKNKDKSSMEEAFFIERDEQFSTIYDYKVARIEADKMLSDYLNGAPQNQNKISEITRSKLIWTAQKAGLVELLYALHASAVFENSQIKAIATYFSDVFDVNLGNIYKTYEEIRLRKKNRTAFLDSLRRNLMRKMEEDD
jgi:hypothetical protein